ncbi:lytic transglycosylase domain-containing protein [Micromonospora sp. MP36]|uniref:lytic transglycosylase domain-containing protein n=1 Tax=unclassified Micromonospora TaxID=2617518 RepID=UPI00351B44B3
MVDGEERSMVRPLRPAVPPDGAAGPIPVPRPRPATEPSPTGAAASAPKPAPADGLDPKPQPTAATADGTKAPTTPPDAPGAKSDPAPADAKPAPNTADATDTNAKPEPAPADAKPAPDTADATDTKQQPNPADAKPQSGSADATTASGAEPKAGGRRRRMPFAHAVRMPPRRLAAAAGRATRDWSRRPSGRTTLPGLFLLVLVAATAVAGALLVPAAIRKPQPVAVDATATAPADGVPQGGVTPGATGLPPGLPGLATGTPPIGGQPTTPTSTGRPADVLAGWAQRVSGPTGIPVVALQAYGYAQLVLEQTHRSCQLSWTTLAAIGYVESRHGSANGATLQPNGVASPEILGDLLDGQGGRSRILDTDKGVLDGNTVYDRALGPMQFIPSTWQEIGTDADNDGAKNPHDIDDAALAAGQYLCKGGRNMTIPGDWWNAILSYNDVRRYAQDVFNKANEYGRLSGT